MNNGHHHPADAQNIHLKNRKLKKNNNKIMEIKTKADKKFKEIACIPSLIVPVPLFHINNSLENI